MNKIGIDIVEVKRVTLKPKLLARILHPDEFVFLERLQAKSAKLAFVAGRWAAKEAIFKVISEKIAPSSISIGYQNDKPVILTPKLTTIEISISHEKKYAVSVALNLQEE